MQTLRASIFPFSEDCSGEHTTGTLCYITFLRVIKFVPVYI